MSDRLQLKDIDDALSGLTWNEVKRMAVHLGMSLPTLIQIEQSYNDPSIRRLHTVDNWLRNCLEPSWSDICDALIAIENRGLATRIQQRYCQSVGTPLTTPGSQPLLATSSDPLPPVTSSTSSRSTSPAHQLPTLPLPSSSQSSPHSLPNPQLAQHNSCSPPPSSPPNLNPPAQARLCEDRNTEVAREASSLEDQFREALTHTENHLQKKKNILEELRTTLTNLRLSSKFKHLPFLRRRRKRIRMMFHFGRSQYISTARNIKEIFEILRDHWNWADFALLQLIVQEFGDRALQNEMKEYVAALTKFEKGTTIQEFTSARLHGRDAPDFYSKIVLQVDLDPAVCTLHEVRQLAESLRKRSCLETYADFLKNVCLSSVVIELACPSSALELVISALDRDFLDTHKIVSVTIDWKPLEEYSDECVKGLQMLRACEEGDKVTVISLLQSGVSPNFKHLNGDSALHWASDGGHTEVVSILLDNGADVHLVNEDGETVLHLASGAGQTAVVSLLLDQGADVHAVDKMGKRTGLMISARRGHLNTVEALIGRGAELNTHDIYLQKTALHMASENGYHETVQLLLKKGADPNSLDKEGWTALMWAARGGHDRTVSTLIEGGSDLNIQDHDGITALMRATLWGHSETVNTLAQCGADLNIQNKDGLTALMRAALWGHLETVKVLVQNGADPNIQNKEGLTALMMAVKEGHTATVNALLEGCALVNIQENSTGWTALFLAIKAGHMEITKKLISAGADILLKDKNGVTALDVARVHGHEELCEILSTNLHSPGEWIMPPPTEKTMSSAQQTTPPSSMQTTPTITVHRSHVFEMLRNLVNKSMMQITEMYRVVERRLKSISEKEQYCKNQDERD